MMKFRTLAAGAAGALALTAVSAAPVSADDRERDALIGAGIGALAGAWLGNGDGTYIAGGAVAGAALGYASADDDDDRYYRNGRYYRDGRYYRNADEWRRYNQRYDRRADRRDWRHDRRDDRRDWRQDRREDRRDWRHDRRQERRW